MSHETFMQEAIKLAEEGMQSGRGGPFGCVIVRAGRVVGRGHNRVTSTNDPTAHAEVVAIRDACANLETFQLTDCELYTSCEPCPMCLSAIYWARIPTVYYGNTRGDAAAIGFDDVSTEASYGPSPSVAIRRSRRAAGNSGRVLRISATHSRLTSRGGRSGSGKYR